MELDDEHKKLTELLKEDFSVEEDLLLIEFMELRRYSL